MANDKTNQYIYIAQSSQETTRCKIGKTGDLERRLKEYNAMTGKSKDNIYRYLFTCEVQDMTQVENNIKDKFSVLREEKSREIYFYNAPLFENYVNFIKAHPLFIKEIFLKADDTPKEIVKIVKRTTPTLKERGLSKKDIMQKAQRAKNDEFYTRYEDIEKEIAMYDKDIWKDKTVFCNCDDAVDDDRDERRTSPFALYFLRNFKELALKKLICTHYGGGIDLFNQGVNGYVFTKDGFKELKEYPKNYSGSFDDPLSLKILNEDADIVCTNPPFSRAADYWKTVIESGKKFLIISNITNVKNKPYMHYFIDNKVWAGYNSVDWFLNPKKELVSAAGHWYTNFPIKNRPKYDLLKITPLKNIPKKYRKYDDSKTLLVAHCYIPSDYEKPFAVSVRPILNGILEKVYKMTQDSEYVPYINGKRCFGRILVQKIEGENMSDKTIELTNLHPSIITFQNDIRAKYAAENQKAEKGQILFVGSSLMEIFPIEKMQQKLGLDKVIYNRGVRATTTADLLNHIDALIFDLSPSKIFMNIGSNDIGFNVPEDVFLANYDEILRRIKTKLPDTAVYVMAYYPINAEDDFGEDKKEHNRLYEHRSNELLESANAKVEQLAQKNGYEFINVNDGLADVNGNLRKDLTFDGAHLLPKGYEIVLNNMRKYLE